MNATKLIAANAQPNWDSAYFYNNRYKWVKLAKHCEETGDTPDAVHARRRKQKWIDGVQCRIGPDGNLYINPAEYEKWVENQPSPV